MTDIVFELAAEVGQTTLANELKIDPATISRFKSGEVGLTLEKLDKLLDYGGIVLISKKRYQWFMDSIINLTDIVKEGIHFDT